MSTIQDYAGSNKILKILYTAKGSYDNLGARIDAIETAAESGGGGTGINNQLVKMNITGSAETPYVTEIAIPMSSDLKLLAPEVIKLASGGEDVSTTLCKFDNADSDSFIANSYIEWSGIMQPKTKYYTNATFVDTLSQGKLYTTTLNKTDISIRKVEVQ